MSTKIYDAYRVKKNVDILKLLRDIKKEFIKDISNNEKLLRLVHSFSLLNAKERWEKEKDGNAKFTLEKNEKGDVDDYWIIKYLKQNENSDSIVEIDLFLNASIFYDDDYWYIKFFVNSGWFVKTLKRIEEKYGLEDYHYQNQVDPPEDIPFEEYELRDKKWDELTKSEGGNFRGGFQFVFFDSFEFGELIRKNYFKGYKTNEELYNHLAYKFNKVKI